MQTTRGVESTQHGAAEAQPQEACRHTHIIEELLASALAYVRCLQAAEARSAPSEAAAAFSAALEVQRAQREAAEAKLREAKASLERKSTLIKELRQKLAEVHMLAEGSRAVELQQQLEAAEGRVKQQQAAQARKDAAIKVTWFL